MLFYLNNAVMIDVTSWNQESGAEDNASIDHCDSGTKLGK
jgi:hypothetical protein